MGSAECDETTAELAAAVGRLLAERGFVVARGGRGGVMAAASRGAREAGGVVIAILPGPDCSEANPYANDVIPTGLGDARNALITRAADAVVAVAGGFGTLSEIGLALKMGKPVIGLHTWSLGQPGGGGDPVLRAASPAEAVALVVRVLG